MATPLELCVQPDLQNVERQHHTGDLAAQTKDIGVIVLAGHFRHERIGAERSPHAGPTIGHDAHPDAGRADQDTALGLSTGNRISHDRSIVGITDNIRRLAADIPVGDATRVELFQQFELEFVTSVVISDPNHVLPRFLSWILFLLY